MSGTTGRAGTVVSQRGALSSMSDTGSLVWGLQGVMTVPNLDDKQKKSLLKIQRPWHQMQHSANSVWAGERRCMVGFREDPGRHIWEEMQWGSRLPDVEGKSLVEAKVWMWRCRSENWGMSEKVWSECQLWTFTQRRMRNSCSLCRLNSSKFRQPLSYQW